VSNCRSEATCIELKVIYSLKGYACRLIKSTHVTVCPGNATINAATVLYSSVLKACFVLLFVYGLCLTDCRFFVNGRQTQIKVRAGLN